MKKQSISLLLGSIFLGLCFFSCNNSSGEAYTLKMKLAKNDKFGQEMDMDMKMNMKIMGQSMDMGMGMKFASSFEVLQDSAGLKQLKLTYDKMKMSMEIKGMGDIPSSSEAMDKASERMVGKSVLMWMNKDNKIIASDGMESVMADTADAVSREQMKKMFTKEQLNSMLGMSFQMYPDKPVKIGDTWERETEMELSGIMMKVKFKYKLVAVKDGVASIDANGKIAGKGSMNQGGMDIEMDMDGTQSGVMNITIADGYLKDGDMKMDMKADMNMMGQKMPMTMKATYLMKGYK